MPNSDKLDLLPGLWWLVDGSPVMAAVYALILTPVMMFVIQLVLEGRRPASYANQFRGFIPGDIFLGLSFGVMVALADKLPDGDNRWFNTGWFQLLALAGAIGVFIVGSRLDEELYSGAQLASPSKVYHDYLLYLGYGYVLLKVGVATLFAAPWSDWPLKVAMLALVGCWVACLLHDAAQPYSRKERMAAKAHVARWRPIWAR